ncbi:LysR family transcriptional regulator [Vibrio inusitatus NBRC 102082]|uniref:LysR family transcriptional regulator n=1 Tax=Vibrio inusitatus NBRC 102082 TaxID=1219070 RepID=A0A4Y3HQS4_9VIBR|nr:LysR family transcriptional regulator [Vibrio inusitatus]GEA49416.1 LysR family transcriptional regulator [Vibrio inusitatus NBRC 102082]
MIKPDLLKCFIAAADTGSFTAAGRLLGKHLATISGNVARLEDELGVQLFNREGKYPQLTEAGLNLYDGAKVVVDSMERFTRNAAHLTEGIPARFCFAVHEDINFQVFAPLIKQAQQRWPHMKIKVSQQSASAIFSAVREHKVDLAFTPSLEGNSQFYEFQAIGHCHVYIVCGKHHPLANKKSVSNDDLMSYTQVLSIDIDDKGPLYTTTVMSPSLCYVNGHTNLVQLVKAGVGWAMVFSVEEEIDSNLKVLSPEFLQTNITVQYDLIWQKNRPLNDVQKFFQNRIKALITNEKN